MHYKEITKKITEIMPKECEVTKIEPEGLAMVIYLKNIPAFYKTESLIKQLAGAIKKKVTIRGDPSILMPVDKAKKEIEFAHKTQTEIIHAEDRGEEIQISLLLTHDQDSLMIAMSEIQLIERLIRIFQK